MKTIPKLVTTFRLCCPELPLQSVNCVAPQCLAGISPGAHKGLIKVGRTASQLASNRVQLDAAARSTRYRNEVQQPTLHGRTAVSGSSTKRERESPLWLTNPPGDPRHHPTRKRKRDFPKPTHRFLCEPWALVDGSNG